MPKKYRRDWLQAMDRLDSHYLSPILTVKVKKNRRPAMNSLRTEGTLLSFSFGWSIPLLSTIVLGFATSTTHADVPVKVIITELYQLGGIDPDNSIGDFYAKVKIGDGDTQSNQPACGDGGLGGIFFPQFLFRDFVATPDCFRRTPWTFVANVPDGNSPIAVEIAVWDDDTITGDDKADLSDAAPDDSSLDLLIDRETGRWSGDINWPETCSRALNDLGQDHARVCIQVSLDSDGDGLLDTWERDGIYIEGVLDLDLPALGADPQHKDLFIELDSMSGNQPHANTVNKTKEAFAAAPVNAGGTDNPDGLPGINLWIDTGAIFDPGSVEDGIGMGSCGDGIDNGLDGLADMADPDCIAGDNLGGGQVLVNRDDISGLSESFYDVKNTNFDPSRKYVFRYGLLSSTHRSTTTPGFADAGASSDTLIDTSQSWLTNEWSELRVEIISGAGAGQVREITENTSTELTVEPDWNTIPDETSEYLINGIGGRGELGGNDFVVFNNARLDTRRRSSLMHEIGHTLNLQHGGDEDHNCKPNYVSIMNYDLPGIPNVGGPRLFDFSPPRHAGPMPRTMPLSPLDENDLDERIPLDQLDEENFFTFKCLFDDGENGDEDSCIDGADNDNDGLIDAADPDCYTPVTWRLNEPVDWDASGPICRGDAVTNSVRRNIDFGGPSDCKKADPNGAISAISTHDDWRNIALSFLEKGDTADAPSGELPSEWTIKEQVQYTEVLESTDMSISKSSDPDPVEVGLDLVYTLTVDNGGPQPAFLVNVLDFLPSSVSYLGDAAECVEDPLGELSCDLGTMLAGDQKQVQLTVSTDDVCSDGLPQELINTATVLHGEEGVGADPDPSNNTAQLSVVPVDTTPPVIESLSVSPDELWAPNHAMQEVTVSVTATDLCDAAPVCTLSAISSNEPGNDKGDGNTPEDWVITGDLTANLRAERSGRGGGRVYTFPFHTIEDKHFCLPL
jgi:uncharacterized repeat protein (TIGR01451 family)